MSAVPFDCVCNLQLVFDQVFDEQQVEVAVEEQEEKKEPCNIHESIANPLGSQTFGECPVCYEELTMINVTITRCGHVMHSSCIFTALEAAPCCPMCRTQLMRDLEDEDDYEDDEDQEEDDEDQDDQDEDDQDEDEDQEDHDSKVSLEKLSTKLENMGYTLTDFLSVWLSESNLKKENPEKYNKELEDKLADDVFGILDGSIPLSSRDTRSYAAVARTNNTV